jgi:HlyD family secretion protein
VPAIGLAAALLALGIAWLVMSLWGGSGNNALASMQFHPVALMDLDVKVVKDGELQAINNIEIVSEVEGQTTIQKLVKEGSTVQKGDILVELDSASIRQKIEDTQLDLQKAEADLTTAREMRDIQESQNQANLEAATVALKLARLDLQQYAEGTYPQQLANAQTELEMARITLKNREEDLAQTRSLAAKGFVTGADVKKSELDVTTARNAVAKAETALRVLTTYSHQMDLASKQNAVSQAEQRLVRTQRENASNISQKNADVAAKEQNLAVIKRRQDRLMQQLAATTIRAPADGMVVYATSGDRNAQNPIQEGATVRERQALLRLPDTSSMKVVLRVTEQQVGRLKPGQRAIIKVSNVPKPLSGTLTRISVMADSGQRWWNPDSKEFPVDIELDDTPDNLKPGMGALAEVFVARLQGVVAVPLSTLYTSGTDSYVFVRAGNDVRPQEVTLGMLNDTHAEVRSGLSAGQQVLVLQMGQGQELAKRFNIKFTPASQPSDLVDRRPRGGEGTNGRGAAGGNGPPGNAAGSSEQAGPPSGDAGGQPTDRVDRPPRGEGSGRPERRGEGAGRRRPGSGDGGGAPANPGS